MRYCTHSASTGEILKWTSHPEAAPEGCVCEERNFDARDGYIDANGTFVPMPAQPGPWAVWDWGAHAWVDSRTLDDLKAEKWAEIKHAREAAKVAPTMATPYGVFDANAVAIENVKSTIIGRRESESLGAQLPPITWTLADDSDVQLTTNQLAEVGVLLLGRGNAAHDIARALRGQITAAESAAALDAITWPA